MNHIEKLKLTRQSWFDQFNQINLIWSSWVDQFHQLPYIVVEVVQLTTELESRLSFASILILLFLQVGGCWNWSYCYLSPNWVVVGAGAELGNIVRYFYMLPNIVQCCAISYNFFQIVLSKKIIQVALFWVEMIFLGILISCPILLILTKRHLTDRLNVQFTWDRT